MNNGNSKPALAAVVPISGQEISTKPQKRVKSIKPIPSEFTHVYWNGNCCEIKSRPEGNRTLIINDPTTGDVKEVGMREVAACHNTSITPKPTGNKVIHSRYGEHRKLSYVVGSLRAAFINQTQLTST